MKYLRVAKVFSRLLKLAHSLDAHMPVGYLMKEFLIQETDIKKVAVTVEAFDRFIEEMAERNISESSWVQVQTEEDLDKKMAFLVKVFDFLITSDEKKLRGESVRVTVPYFDQIASLPLVFFSNMPLSQNLFLFSCGDERVAGLYE